MGLDGLVFNSQTTQVAVEQLVGAHRPGVVAYRSRPSATHADAAADRGSDAAAGPLRLLFVGNLTPVKGLHTLLQALGMCRRICGV